MPASDAHSMEAREIGKAAARAAASWVIDGNTDTEHVRRVVAMLDAGDPEAFDYLPREPNLSGEWADDQTPLSLARFVTGEDDPDSDTVELLAQVFEEAVNETFVPECERILRAALPEDES